LRRPRRTSLGTIMVLAAGAAATTAFVVSLDEPDQSTESGPRLGIGYYMKDAALTGTAEDGRILYRLETREIRQTLGDGTVEMAGVEIRYEPGAQVPWDLSAETGRIPNGGKMIELSGDVVAVTREDGGEPAVIRTDYLQLDAASYVAYTEHKVTIDYGDNRLFATGMRAFLKEDRLQLISNVNGKFLP